MSLLPSNNSELEHAIARLTNELILGIDSDVIYRSRDPMLCDKKFLPWLAWQRSISDDEGWRFAKNETSKRDLIQGYIKKHQHKGTPSVIRQLFRDLQLGEIEILENAASLRWNGEAVFDGKHVFGGGVDDWAKYAIILKRVISNQQSEDLKQILHAIAPLRCELLYIDFRNVALVWDGEINFDGSYNFGAV